MEQLLSNFQDLQAFGVPSRHLRGHCRSETSLQVAISVPGPCAVMNGVGSSVGCHYHRRWRDIRLSRVETACMRSARCAVLQNPSTSSPCLLSLMIDLTSQESVWSSRRNNNQTYQGCVFIVELRGLFDMAQPYPFTMYIQHQACR